MTIDYRDYHEEVLMMDENLTDYSVSIILDGRGTNHSCETNRSLELTARIVGEGDDYLDLEDVKLKDYLNVLDHDKQRKARIDKKYVIGVFLE